MESERGEHFSFDWRDDPQIFEANSFVIGHTLELVMVVCLESSTQE